MKFLTLSPKMRILLPLVGSAGAVLLFLLLVWPSGSGGKKSHARYSRQNHQHSRVADDSRGAGWQPDKPVRNSQRNTSGTSNRRSDELADLTEKISRPEPEGETWWYQEKESHKSKPAKSDWWYKD